MTTSIFWLHGRQGVTPGRWGLVFVFLLFVGVMPSRYTAAAEVGFQPPGRVVPRLAAPVPARHHVAQWMQLPQPAATPDHVTRALAAARRLLRDAEAVTAGRVPTTVDAALPAGTTIYGTVKSAEGNVRSSPEMGKNVIGVVHRGDRLVFLGVAGDWYLVQLGKPRSTRSSIPGDSGWVSHIIVHAPDRQPPTIALDRVTVPDQSRASFSWGSSTNGRLIYQEDGALHFSVTKEQSRDGLAARVDATSSDRPITEVSFVATLQWSQGHAPGGVVFHAMLGDGRDLQLRVGPGEGYPWMDFMLDGATHVARGRGFPYQEPVLIRLVWTGSEVRLSVNGVQRVHLPVAQPLTTVRFSLDADEGCIFHLKVDAFKVVFSDK